MMTIKTDKDAADDLVTFFKRMKLGLELEMAKFDENGCTCNDCQMACRSKPGWFKPGEVEKVAIYLDISLQELFDTKLGVDWWVDIDDIFLLAPATTRMVKGREYPANPRGQCVFFEDGLCSIYPVRPFECKAYDHSNGSKILQERHGQVADEWEAYQNQINSLLGREPEAEDYND